MLTVLVIDSKPILIEGLKKILKEHYHTAIVSGVSDINDFHKSEEHGHLSLILLGINEYMSIKMTSMIHDIKRKYPKTPLVAYQQLNGHSLEDDVLLLKLGVSGYLSNTSAPSEFLTCVKTVLNGQRYINSERLPAVLDRLLDAHAPNKKKLLEVKLTSRQNEVAKLLITGTKVSYIADTLGLKISTISSIKKTIFVKLKVDNILELSDVMAVS